MPRMALAQNPNVTIQRPRCGVCVSNWGDCRCKDLDLSQLDIVEIPSLMFKHFKYLWDVILYLILISRRILKIREIHFPDLSQTMLFLMEERGKSREKGFDLKICVTRYVSDLTVRSA